MTPSKKGLLTPLIPVGDAWFASTVAYDLHRLGASPEDVRHYLYGNALKTICAYIEEHGRRIYGPFVKGRGLSRRPPSEFWTAGGITLTCP